MSLIFVLAVLIPFFICVPVLIGIYVYRDARRRRMNAPLWALIALLTPSLFGFLVYLLVRSSHSDLKCPRCDGAVEAGFAVCPHCGTRLKAACPHCAATVEPTWRVCPQCASPLSQTAATCVPPVQHKDRWLSKILAAVVLVPLFLLLILFLAFQATNRVGAMNTTYLTPESYLDAKSDHPAMEELQFWLATCLTDPDRAYVLHHETTREGQPIHQYLIYYPAAESTTAIETDHDTSLLGTTLTVDYLSTDEETDYVLCTVSIYAQRAPKLKICSDGEPLEYEITNVAYDLTLFEILSAAE